MVDETSGELGHVAELSAVLDRKRSILFSTRIRFSPNAQSLREAALERMVELVLLLKHPLRLSLPAVTAEMHGSLGGGLATVTEADVRRALGKLVEEGLATGEGEGHEERTYELTERGRQEIGALEDDATRRMNRIVVGLFKHARPSPQTYYSPFIECIRRIFTTLAEAYVQLIKGDIDPSEFAANQAVRDAIVAVASSHRKVNVADLELGVNRFLIETDPEYDAVKWNMTQNFYLIRVLGIDAGAYLLSADVFGGAQFYLDTNVVIAALQPRERFHEEYTKLAAAFRSLGIETMVCQVTLDELRLVVGYEKAEIQKAAGQVPDEMEPQVSDRFFHAFREAQRRGEPDPIGSVFAAFENPIASLSQLADAELIDDNWFDDIARDSETEALVSELQQVAENLHPGRTKKDRAALHDALLLRWIERTRASGAQNSWVLTLDGSLCAFEGDKDRGSSIHRNLALTLDAVLLWLAPVVSQGGIVGEDLADIFADALRNQLLPKQKLFDLRDFMIFAEIGWECRELPAEDVEQCLRFIERELPRLDPTKAEDRERLNAEISKFFLDPSRKYISTIHALEGEVASLRLSLDTSTDAQERQFDKLTREFNRQTQRTNDEQRRELDGINASLEEVSKELEAERQLRATERLKESGKWRLVVACVLLLAIQGTLLVVTNDQGAGKTSLQRIESLWHFHALAFVAWALLTGLLVGRQRAAALGWPATLVRSGERDQSGVAGQ